MDKYLNSELSADLKTKVAWLYFIISLLSMLGGLTRVSGVNPSEFACRLNAI